MLERLQVYVEDNESWREFQKGNVSLSLELMRKIRVSEAQFDVDFFRRGLQFFRVRAIELPLSPYIQWELQFHILSAQYGETILVADLTNAKDDHLLWDSRDFLLFDEFAVLIHDYDSSGVLLGGWVCKDEQLVKRYSNLAEKMTLVSLPLAVFMNDHPSRLGA